MTTLQPHRPSSRPVPVKRGPRRRLPLVALVAVAFAGVGDFARTLGIQGALTVLVAGLVLILAIAALLTGPGKVAGRVLPPVALVVFTLMAAMSLSVTTALVNGVQNVLIYVIFTLTIPVVAAAMRTPAVGVLLLKALRLAGVVGAVLYLVGVARYGLNTDFGFLTARAAAGTLLVPLIAAGVLSLHLGARRWPLLVMGAALLSTLSRAQTGEMLVLLVVVVALNSERWFVAVLRFAAAALAGVLAVVYAYQNYAPFRDRFENSDGYTVGGFTLGSSGRSRLWATTIDGWKDHPWLGNGAGTSEQLILRVHPPNVHPHNDFLRILHDFGVVGLALWVAGFVVLVAAFWRGYRKATSSNEKAIHLSALLAALFLVMEMTPNNPVTAIFIMMPIAALFGASWGLVPRPVRPGAPRTTRTGPALRARTGQPASRL